MPHPPEIDTLIDKVIALEGDYSDHPADRGGPTRWGITGISGTVYSIDLFPAAF